MEVKVSGKNVVIKLPIDILVYAFDNKDDNFQAYKIKYKQKFAQGVAKYLSDHSENQETGLTVFEEMMDKIFDEMVCNAEDYIKELQSDF